MHGRFARQVMLICGKKSALTVAISGVARVCVIDYGKAAN
jgi:hypothetical protein